MTRAHIDGLPSPHPIIDQLPAIYQEDHFARMFEQRGQHFGGLVAKPDAQAWPASVEEGQGAWAVVAPRGENTIEVETATPVGAWVGLWSYLSSSAIAAFGAITSILMIAIYLHLRWRKMARRRGAA